MVWTLEDKRAAGRRWARENMDVIERNRARYRARNKAILAEARKPGCERCDESDPVCLDFHHVGPKTAEVGLAVKNCWGEQRLRDELANCIVLCANCHRKEHGRRDSNSGASA